MKTNLGVLVAGVLALAGSATLSLGQSFDSPAVVQNKAWAAWPRTKEAFPAFRFEAGLRSDAFSSANRETLKNIAWARSPRTLEQFSELLRPTPQPLVSRPADAELLKNRGWAASPRVREEFPWIDRGGPVTAPTSAVHVAPLK
jgi:hypothetical protein